MAEFIKNTGQTTSEGGSCDETTAKKGHNFAQGDDSKVVILRKNRITPSVAAPGDTNPSNDTGGSYLNTTVKQEEVDHATVAFPTLRKWEGFNA